MRTRIVCWGIATAVAVAAGGPALADDLTLIDAVKRQDKAAITARLHQHADVNARQADGATALHWAAHRDDVDTAVLLIHAGADVNAANDLGVTPILLASANGNATMVDTLLTAGANANAPALSTRETPLMAAARSGNEAAVRALLTHGADVNAAETAHGQTALMWAAARGHSAVVRALIEARADIHARSRAGRRIVYLGPRIGGGGNRSAEADAPGVVDAAEGGFTALMFAARSGDVTSATLLIQAKADVNDAGADGTAAVAVAAHSGNGAVAAALLDHGADPNAAHTGYTPLHAAVLRGDLPLVKALLAHGANPNVRLTAGTPARRFSHDYALSETLIGATPFLLAAKYLEVDMMRALADAGAGWQGALKDGTTAVMLAAGIGSGADRRDRGYAAIARLATRDQRDREEHAARDAIALAIGLGADVTAANDDGDTALHGAAAAEFTSVVEVLVASGAKLDTRNKRGQTPLIIATASRRRGTPGAAGPSTAESATAALLRKLGAKE